MSKLKNDLKKVLKTYQQQYQYDYNSALLKLNTYSQLKNIVNEEELLLCDSKDINNRVKIIYIILYKKIENTFM